MLIYFKSPTFKAGHKPRQNNAPDFEARLWSDLVQEYLTKQFTVYFESLLGQEQFQKKKTW